MASSNKRPKTESSAPATPSAMIPSYLRARFSDKGSALRDQPSSRRRQLFSEGEEPAVAASSSSASSPVKPKKLAMGKNGAARPKGKAQGGSNKSSGVGSGLIKVSEEAEGDEDVNLSREQRRSQSLSAKHPQPGKISSLLPVSCCTRIWGHPCRPSSPCFVCALRFLAMLSCYAPCTPPPLDSIPALPTPLTIPADVPRRSA